MTGVPVGVVALWNAGVGPRGAPIVIRLHHRASSNRRRSDSSTVSSRPAVSDFSAKHSCHAVRSRVVVWLASACRHVCLPPVPIFSPIVLGSCSTLGQTVLPKGLFFCCCWRFELFSPYSSTRFILWHDRGFDDRTLIADAAASAAAAAVHRTASSSYSFICPDRIPVFVSFVLEHRAAVH